MAEAAAAASIAEQVWVRIESEIIERSTGSETRADERIKSESLQRLNYLVIEQVYNEETHTAFVLVETAF